MVYIYTQEGVPGARRSAWKAHGKRSRRNGSAPWAGTACQDYVSTLECSCEIVSSYQVVYEAVKGFDGNRRQIVKDMGFDGFLQFPNLSVVWQQFGCSGS